MTLGKGIGGGVPLGGAAGNETSVLLRARRPGRHIQRQSADVRGGAGGAPASREPAFLKAVVDAGLSLESELQRLSARHGLGEVRGRGLLLALDLKLPIGAARCRAGVGGRRLLLNSPQPDALRFMPALNVTREEISEMIDGLYAILMKIGVARRVA